MTDVPSRGYNRLVKARRYGRMWMLKGLKEEYSGQSVYEALLRKEFDITVSLQHPGICAASSFENVAGVGPCIVMEWVDGVTLAEWLTQKNISQKRRMSVFNQVLDAVEYAHSHQVAHRDLKPSNILITRNGERVKLIDFGLGDADNYLILKQPAGTKGYTSPEQARMATPDQRNDVFSLGCVMCDLRLGLWARPVINHCRRKAEKRYASVAALRKALKRTHSFYYIMVWCVVALCLVAAVLPFLTQPVAGGGDTEVISARGEDSTAVVANVHEDTASLPAQRPFIPKEKGKEKTTSGKNDVAQLLALGKAELDKRVAAYGMDARLDTLTRISYLERLAVEIVEDVKVFARQYAQGCTLPDDLSAEESENARMEIENGLLLYFNDQYFFPWDKRWEHLSY